MPEAVYFDPKDSRRGVIAQAFVNAAAALPVEDTSWSSWFASHFLGPSSPKGRMLAAHAEWHALVKRKQWGHPDVVLTAAVYAAANHGVRDSFLAALETTAGPKVAERAYVNANRGYLDYAAEFASAGGQQQKIREIENRVLDAMEAYYDAKDVAFYGTIFAAGGALLFVATR